LEQDIRPAGVLSTQEKQAHPLKWRYEHPAAGIHPMEKKK
jgi:hypothetical protein